MKIAIIGWYGTETIGDRAILAGLFSLFNKSFNKFEVFLGSLYPFFSERTINEDNSFWQKILEKNIEVKLFNSKSVSVLNSYIKKSDLIVMGGGPLMHIPEMAMIEYALKRAKNLGKKTALLGIGVGPLFKKKYKRCLIKIVKHSDLVILRDNISRSCLVDIYKEYNNKIKGDNIFTSFDPSVECAIRFNDLCKNNKRDDYIAINLRKYPEEYANISNCKLIDNKIVELIKYISENYNDNLIKLIPMHYFHIGGDDREYLNEIKYKLNKENIFVQNSNLNLKETMQVYKNAHINIGMRYHSIVLQTVLRGNNYILDYTDPKYGKISGFINDIDKYGFYRDRYLSLQSLDESNIKTLIELSVKSVFDVDYNYLKMKLDIYIKKLKELIYENPSY